MQATVLATTKAGQMVTDEEFKELEPDNLASIPIVEDLSADAIALVMTAKANRRPFNAIILAVVKRTQTYSNLSADGFQLRLTGNKLPLVVFETSSGCDKQRICGIAQKAVEVKAYKPYGTIPGGKLIHTFADFRTGEGRIFFCRTDKPGGDIHPEVPSSEPAPNHHLPSVEAIPKEVLVKRQRLRVLQGYVLASDRLQKMEISYTDLKNEDPEAYEILISKSNRQYAFSLAKEGHLRYVSRALFEVQPSASQQA